MRALANSAFALSYTLAMSAAGAVAQFANPSGRVIRGVARAWGVGMCEACGIRLSVEGADGVDWDRPLILMANHQSFLDIPVLYAALPRSFGMLAKRELFRIPVFRSAMKGMGCIPIDRDNRRRSFDSLRTAATEVRQGRSIVVFPEGTRSRDGRIQRLKKGPFYLADMARVEVVPVGISGTRRALPRGAFYIWPADVHVRIGKAISPRARGAEARDQLCDEVRQALVELSGNDAVPLQDQASHAKWGDSP